MDDFIASGGVATVLALTLDAWAVITPPAAGELEEHTSIRLYSAMVRKRDRQRHRFLIRYEDVEVDADLPVSTARKDIVFFPGHDGVLYFCLEAKRLNASVNGVMKSLADEYAKNGMRQFVDGSSNDGEHSICLAYHSPSVPAIPVVPRLVQRRLDSPIATTWQIRAKESRLWTASRRDRRQRLPYGGPTSPG